MARSSRAADCSRAARRMMLSVGREATRRISPACDCGPGSAAAAGAACSKARHRLNASARRLALRAYGLYVCHVCVSMLRRADKQVERGLGSAKVSLFAVISGLRRMFFADGFCQNISPHGHHGATAWYPTGCKTVGFAARNRPPWSAKQLVRQGKDARLERQGDRRGSEQGAFVTYNYHGGKWRKTSRLKPE